MSDNSNLLLTTSRTDAEIMPDLGRTILRGLIAGLAGGAAFAAATIDLGLLETIALLFRAESPLIGFAAHMVIASIIGAGFAILVFFHRPDPGETVFWGLTYGALWWFIGAVTLLPLLSGQTPAWRIEDAQPLVPALIGHLIYGGVVGLVLAIGRSTIIGAPATSTSNSTSNSRRTASASLRSVGTVIRGGMAGLLGGVLLGLVLDDRFGVPAVSGPMVETSRSVAWLVTLGLGLIAGIGFALLFPTNDRGTGPTLIRGVAFGFALWLVFALSLIPLAIGDGLQWEADAVRDGFGTLPGYLLLLGCLLYTSPSPRDRG